MDKLDFFKIKNNFSGEDNIKRMRRQGIDCEKIFVKDIFDYRLLSKMCKELLKLTKTPS